VGERVDPVVTLSRQECQELAGYLRRVRPHGHDEEERVHLLVKKLEGRNVG